MQKFVIEIFCSITDWIRIISAETPSTWPSIAKILSFIICNEFFKFHFDFSYLVYSLAVVLSNLFVNILGKILKTVILNKVIMINDLYRVVLFHICYCFRYFFWILFELLMHLNLFWDFFNLHDSLLQSKFDCNCLVPHIMDAHVHKKLWWRDFFFKLLHLRGNFSHSIDFELHLASQPLFAGPNLSRQELTFTLA